VVFLGKRKRDREDREERKSLREIKPWNVLMAKNLKKSSSQNTENPLQTQLLSQDPNKRIL